VWWLGRSLGWYERTGRSLRAAGVGAIEGNDGSDVRGGVSLGSSSIRSGGEGYRLLLYRQIQKLYLMMTPLISSRAIFFSVMIGIAACLCMTVS
jgi:hypothetical protein